MIVLIKILKKKIKVFFIAQYKAGSDKFESVVKEMQKDDIFDVKVLAIPNDINNLRKNEDFDYWNNIFNGITIDAIENNSWFDLKKEKPDYVFIQRPYDGLVPIEYRKTTLREYTKVCYIPYGFSMVSIFDISMKQEDMESIDIIFAEHEEVNEFYKNLINSIDDDKKRISICLGYPSLDKAKEKADSQNSAFKMIDKKMQNNILWTPRWTTDKDAVETSFFDYKDNLIEYAKKRTNINLVFRPHPLTFNNFIEKKLMTKKEVQDYLAYYKDNLYYDNSSDYLDTFKDTDILVSDFSSILAEFFLFDKPIVYTQKDTYKKLKYLELLEQAFYKVSNKIELFKVLDNLREGKDPLKEKRNKIKAELFKKYDGKVAFRIKEFIKENFNNKTN